MIREYSCLGSIYGGTEVTITGDGFTPADTRVIVGSIDYTSMATITYSQIIFTTQIPPSIYIDQPIPITILIGTNTAICLLAACSFTWADSVTPYLDTVNPTSITGPQLLTLTGRNLQATGSVLITDIHVTISGQTCNVTSASNTTISCQIVSIQAGNQLIVASIDGICSCFEKNRNIFLTYSRCRDNFIISSSYISANCFKCVTNDHWNLWWIFSYH